MITMRGDVCRCKVPHTPAQAILMRRRGSINLEPLPHLEHVFQKSVNEQVSFEVIAR